MRRVQVRWRQMMAFNGQFFAIDIRGNMWQRTPESPTGWKKVDAPYIEVPDAQPITQIPQNLQSTHRSLTTPALRGW